MRRRRFLQVAGVAGAGVAAGCGTGTPDHLLPYLVPSDDLVPGIPTWYASTCRECPAGCGILVKAREGRAIKVEGNPHHPVNRGRLCARGQAALQGLYDPDRVTQPRKREGNVWKPITWDDAETEIATALGAAASAGADRVAFVTGAESGTLDRFYDVFLGAFRSTRRLRYEAFAFEPLREASRLTFGLATVPRYDFASARYVLSFGADFLETWLSPTEFGRGFASTHGYRDGRMAKFVAVEPRRGMTGFNADEWVAPKPGTEGMLALGIASSLMRQGKARVAGVDADRLRAILARFDPGTVAEATEVEEAVIERLAREFGDAQPSLAVAGGVAHQHRAATQTAVAVNLLNYIAGNVGRTVRFLSSSPWERVSRYADMRSLVAAMNEGGVDVALVHGTNPAFTLPATAGFVEAFAKVRLKVAFASHPDETAELADLVLPDHTPLEQWGDIEPIAGVRSLVQPVMMPVHDTKQTADVLLSVAQKAGKSVAPAGVATARDLLAAGRPERDFDRLLQAGGEFAEAAPRAVRLTTDFARLGWALPAFDGPADGLVLLAVPHVGLYDGRGANKGWLQELPDPTTKITWQTWVEVHPETATRLGVRSGDLVTVSAGERQVEAVVCVFPGVRRDVVAMPIGQGHTAYGRLARGRGASPLALFAADATDPSGALAFCQTRVTLTRTGGRRPLATTEGSPRQHDRGIARAVAFTAIAAGHAPEEEHEALTESERTAIDSAEASQRRRAELGRYGEDNPKWEMAIDLSRCTGCSACVAACYAENNIPVVGESQVVRSREMAWIRIERFYDGFAGGENDLPTGTDFEVRQIPMLCQQCANAPCEPVCPVYAAYHTPDGLNGQIYNRCVGTRYCANNCPYKVRYFNWWDYGHPASDEYAFPGTLSWLLNPDVTVRTKGVMEKCTFCVQRIRFAQNDARVRGATLRDGDVTPACAQTCPADAITFGDAHDPNSRVSRKKLDERGYHVFQQLNTKPGITYLRRVIRSGEA
ncbi:MAG: molybdopterin-dependent oxidoreductase [Gemmatimonadetes bacterium]|nr:molybdopterin-dependent oxidoreductase [Gemmatimonadota bacterium]